MGKSAQIKNGSYVLIPAFLRTEYSLSCNDMIIAAVIFGFSQDGKSAFTGSLSYLQAWTGLTKQGIIKILKKLVDAGIITKESEMRNGVKFCSYRMGGEISLPLVNSSLPLLNSVERGVLNSVERGIKLSLPNNKEDNIDINNKEGVYSEHPATRYEKFLKWMEAEAPYCYSRLTLPTEKQFNKLLDDYGNKDVIDIIQEIENRKDKRKNYSNLNLTIRSWMRYREKAK